MPAALGPLMPVLEAQSAGALGDESADAEAIVLAVGDNKSSDLDGEQARPMPVA